MGAVVRWAALIVALACFTSAWADPAPGAKTMPWDPAIRHGVLPNGLRYAVMHNATPSGAVSIRLGVKVGALDERDDELGAAHFLEHMAFGVSHEQLQADVEKAFSDAGVAYGRDRNAHTTADATTYEIDLPHADPASLDLGFRWLRRVADGGHFTPDAVERERGVILAERETRLSAISEASDQSDAFHTPGSRFGKAPLIGTVASIKALTAAQLQAFYDRWYQPSNAAIVVAGDEPLDVLEAKVKATFGDWRGAGQPLPPRLPVVVDASRGLDVMTLAGPNAPAAVGVCRLGPYADGDQLSRLKHEIGASVWSEIVNARLRQAALSPESGFVGAQAVAGDYFGRAELACLIAIPLDGGWSKSLATLGAATADLARTPPSEDEFETAVKSLRATLRGALFAASTRASGKLADGILTMLLKGYAEPSPAESFSAFDDAVEDMTPADAQAAFRRDWSGAGPLVNVVTPTAIDAGQVRQAWLSADHSTVAKPAPAAQAWAYGEFGKPGKVVRRQVVAGADFVRLTFANGAVVNFKHADFERDNVSVRLTFGDGRAGLAPADFFAASLGTAMLPLGGMARNSQADIDAQFPDEGIKVAASMKSHAFVLSTSTTTETYADALQVLTAYVTEPGFRSVDTTLPTLWSAGLRTARGLPSVVAQESMFDAVSPGNPVTIKAAEAEPMSGADVVRVLKPILTGSPLELTIVGDTDEKRVIAAAAATIGAIPPRRAGPPARSDAWFLRFPEHPPTLVTATHEGPPEKAVVAMVWPLWVADPSRRQEERALLLAARVMSDALLREIRGDMGKAYSPAAATSMPDHADQGYLLAETEVAAADVDAVRAQMAAVAARIAKGDFTDQDLENARKPYLAALAKRFATDDFWADVLSGSSVDDTAVKEMPGYQAAIAAITPAEVRKAAAEWLTRPPIVVVVTGRAPALAKEDPKP